MHPNFFPTSRRAVLTRDTRSDVVTHINMGVSLGHLIRNTAAGFHLSSDGILLHLLQNTNSSSRRSLSVE